MKNTPISTYIVTTRSLSRKIICDMFTNIPAGEWLAAYSPAVMDRAVSGGEVTIFMDPMWPSTKELMIAASDIVTIAKVDDVKVLTLYTKFRYSLLAGEYQGNLKVGPSLKLQLPSQQSSNTAPPVLN